MMRQGVGFQVKRLGNLGRARALRGVAHQQAEYRKPGWVAKSRKRN